MSVPVHHRSVAGQRRPRQDVHGHKKRTKNKSIPGPRSGGLGQVREALLMQLV